MRRFVTIVGALASMAGLTTFVPAEAGGPAPIPSPIVPLTMDTDTFVIEAQGGPDFYEVAGLPPGDTLNIRSGPGTGNRIVARAPNGAVLRNLGCQGSGDTRWCQVETRNGSIAGWVAGRYLRESGGGSGGGAAGSGGAATNMRGIGLVTKGGPLIGRITSKTGRSYVLVLTATKDGFTCTGSFDEPPGGRSSLSTIIHCTNGESGSAILKGDVLTFSAGGNGGYVQF